MNILLLQGPLGPFFNRLAEVLMNENHEVFRIHFNAGDRFYSGQGQCHDFNQSLAQWPDFLKNFIDNNAIDTVVLYGGCRPHNKKAITIAKTMNCACKVLEEGYLRPDWITCENFGVNAASTFLQQNDFKQESRRLKPADQQDLTGNTFLQRSLYASLYFHAMWWQQRDFSHYSKQHHITPSPWIQGALWLKSFYRKFAYKKADQLSFDNALKRFGDRFFILPLQVATDSQIIAHSSFDSMEDLIHFTVKSFAKHAPKDTALLIKHHPVDRGHAHYGDFINQLIEDYDLTGRVIYGHDWHLPDLLRHTLGVVTLNSTVGISALIHHLPVKVLGEAFWDIEQITSQKSLSSFWKSPDQPNKALIGKLLAAIRYHTQFKGSFYKNMDALAFDLSSHLIESHNLRISPDNILCFKPAA